MVNYLKLSALSKLSEKTIIYSIILKLLKDIKTKCYQKVKQILGVKGLRRN